MLLENLQNRPVPAFRTGKSSHSRMRQGGSQFRSYLRSDDNGDVHATQEIQVIHPVAKPHGDNVVERPAVIAGKKADAIGFVCVPRDVMEAPAACPVSAASTRSLQEVQLPGGSRISNGSSYSLILANRDCSRDRPYLRLTSSALMSWKPRTRQPVSCEAWCNVSTRSL